MSDSLNDWTINTAKQRAVRADGDADVDYYTDSEAVEVGIFVEGVFGSEGSWHYVTIPWSVLRAIREAGEAGVADADD
jgi:hypothetical protein